MLRIAYQNTDVDVRGTLARNACEDSLSDSGMKWAVHRGNPKTIETAVKLALGFDAFRGQPSKDDIKHLCGYRLRNLYRKIRRTITVKTDLEILVGIKSYVFTAH